MKKILVIEDETLIREQLIEILKFKDFDVYGAEHGEIGVEKAEKILPDLILCDINMPKLDGYGVLHELRKNLSTATIPFIFLTAQDTPDSRRKGMVLGAEDYISKPFTVEELLESIRTRLAKHDIITRQNQERLAELRDNIIYALPHEFRTPLTAIYGFTDFLNNNYATIERERIKEITEAMKKSVERLTRLIQNQLEYSKLEVMMSYPEEIQKIRMFTLQTPGEVIRSVAEDAAKSNRRYDDLNMEIEEAAIHCTFDNLSKIIEELIGNAFKFSDPGSPVKLKTYSGELVYFIEISNIGVGMTPLQIQNIGAYMQFDRKKREQQGAGFGLVIVKKLVDLHDGVILIDSIPNESTTITVKLKLKS